MDNKNIVNNVSDIPVNTVYLTNLYAYAQKEDGTLTYHGRYMSQEYYERVEQAFPDTANILAQVFTIPMTVNTDRLWNIGSHDLDKIQNYIQSTQQEIAQVLTDSSEKEGNDHETLDYEGEIYGTIEDLKRVVEDYCFDKETLLSFQQELDELKKSLQTFLHTDLSQKIQRYHEDETLGDPLVQQVEFINKRLDRFIKMQPEPIRTIMTRRHDGHFNDIEDFSFHYLQQRYHPNNETLQAEVND